MQIIKVKTKELKPDPNQPRKEIDEEKVKEMAVSVRNEGIINPIEIDKDNMIITGEVRWRGALESELEEVPCKVLEIEPRARYIRQMQENLHHNTMSIWDTAKGLEKTIKLMKPIWIKEIGSPGEPIDGRKIRYEIFLEKLVELYGSAQATISEYLSLLQESPEVQKALKTSKVKRTKIRAANKAPEQFRNELKMKVINEPKIARDAIDQITTVLKRAVEEGEIKKGKEILKQDFTGLNSFEIVKKINDIYPDKGIEILDSSDKRAKKIMDTIQELMNFLKNNPLTSFVGFDVSPIKLQVKIFDEFLKEYLEEK